MLYNILLVAGEKVMDGPSLQVGLLFLLLSIYDCNLQTIGHSV